MRKIISATLCLFLCATFVSAQGQTVKLEPLGEVTVPYNKSLDGTPIGGLSGLTYDSKSQTFFVISDDRSEYVDACFYSFKISLGKNEKLSQDNIQWQQKTTLNNVSGKSYARRRIDPEGIAIGKEGELYISSEGVPAKNIAPFVNSYDKKGHFKESLPVPESFWPSSKENRRDKGVRPNLGFEGLSTTPDGSTLYAAIENALKQDGPKADSKHSSPARIIAYNLNNHQIEHQYQYNVEPIDYTGAKKDGFAVNGVSEVLTLDNEGTLLVIERNFVEGAGNTIRLYQVSTAGATDIQGVESLSKYSGQIDPASKKLIAKLSDHGITIDNFEGLAIGPPLAGGRLLLMVSDNNFSESQKTLITAFRLKY